MDVMRCAVDKCSPGIVVVDVDDVEEEVRTVVAVSVVAPSVVDVATAMGVPSSVSGTRQACRTAATSAGKTNTARRAITDTLN